ncbi:MAG: hypothetical protein FWD78_09390 [Treponema sp.]|nr:hypothetical protein [Treponema sp.]
MTDRAVLIKEIDKLSPKYYGEVYDFVGYLQRKKQIDQEADTAAYKAMAADTEREQEAHEWCNAYFGPVSKL